MSAANQSQKDAKKGDSIESKPVGGASQEQKPAATLEEDDEFEDFPVEGT
jgi:hypothetical protein